MNTVEFSRLIHKFFSNPLTKDFKDRFGQWFVGNKLNDEKLKAMEGLWLEESANVKADVQTLRDLESLHLRIANSSPKRSYCHILCGINYNKAACYRFIKVLFISE